MNLQSPGVHLVFSSVTTIGAIRMGRVGRTHPSSRLHGLVLTGASRSRARSAAVSLSMRRQTVGWIWLTTLPANVDDLVFPRFALFVQGMLLTSSASLLFSPVHMLQYPMQNDLCWPSKMCRGLSRSLSRVCSGTGTQDTSSPPRGIGRRLTSARSDATSSVTVTVSDTGSVARHARQRRDASDTQA